MLLGGWSDNELGLILIGTMMRVRASRPADLDETKFVDEVKGLLSLA